MVNQRRRILLVEGNKMFSNAFVDNMETHLPQLEVQVVRVGREAVDLIQGDGIGSFDLVIVEPANVDGWQLVLSAAQTAKINFLILTIAPWRLQGQLDTQICDKTRLSPQQIREKVVEALGRKTLGVLV